MQKCFSKAQGISKLTRLSSILITIGTLSSSSIAYADVNGIPFNPDFPNAEYPYAQAPDACSGVTNRPDSNGEIRDTWGPVDFRGACNTHDKCYYTVGSNWNTCNERLYSDLRAACERDLKVSFNVPAPTLTDPLRTRRVDGPPDPARLAACYTIASGYYAGVQGGVALGVFDKAQDKQKRYESWVSSVRNPAQKTDSSSFHLTCRNISINSNILSAECDSGGGSYVTTSIGLRGIWNRNGTLQEDPNSNSSSFQLSCRDSSIQGNVLSASCDNGNGAVIRSQLRLGRIWNDHGTLRY